MAALGITTDQEFVPDERFLTSTHHHQAQPGMGERKRDASQVKQTAKIEGDFDAWLERAPIQT